MKKSSHNSILMGNNGGERKRLTYGDEGEMNYPLMETPFALTQFEEMSRKQAEQYFQWFLTEKEHRIKQLEQYIKQSDKSISLDKTPESLIGLWEWFEANIEWVSKTEEDFTNEMVGRPDWMRPHILESTKKMTILTLALAMDISIYSGETLIASNPSIYWGYKTSPKKLMGVNRPILLGFKGDINFFPYNQIQVCMRRSTREENKYELQELYKIWCNNV